MDTSHTKIIVLQKSPLAEEMAEDGTSDVHGAGEDRGPQPSTSPAEDKAQHSTVASDEGIIPQTVSEPAEVPTSEEQAITTSDLNNSAQETNKVGMWTKLKRAISRRRGSSKSLLGVDKMSSGPDDSAVPATEESGGRHRPWLNPHGEARKGILEPRVMESLELPWGTKSIVLPSRVPMYPKCKPADLAEYDYLVQVPLGLGPEALIAFHRLALLVPPWATPGGHIVVAYSEKGGADSFRVLGFVPPGQDSILTVLMGMKLSHACHVHAHPCTIGTKPDIDEEAEAAARAARVLAAKERAAEGLRTELLELRLMLGKSLESLKVAGRVVREAARRRAVEEDGFLARQRVLLHMDRLKTHADAQVQAIRRLDVLAGRSAHALAAVERLLTAHSGSAAALAVAICTHAQEQEHAELLREEAPDAEQPPLMDPALHWAIRGTAEEGPEGPGAAAERARAHLEEEEERALLESLGELSAEAVGALARLDAVDGGVGEEEHEALLDEVIRALVVEHARLVPVLREGQERCERCGLSLVRELESAAELSEATTQAAAWVGRLGQYEGVVAANGAVLHAKLRAVRYSRAALAQGDALACAAAERSVPPANLDLQVYALIAAAYQELEPAMPVARVGQ